MKRQIFICGCFAMALFLNCAPKERALYVAPDGNDENPGTFARPFETLERAKAAVNGIKARDGLDGGITVWLRGGEYVRNKGFKLTEKDSGEPGAPIVYASTPEETVILRGGRELPPDSFSPVTNDAVKALIPAEAQEHVLVCDLKSLGIEEYGSIKPFGFGQKVAPVSPELFFNGEPMTLSRWPNEGFTKTGEVKDSGSVPRWGETENRGALFVFPNDRLERWATADGLWLHGYWNHDWADQSIKVADIDLEDEAIKLAFAHNYGVAEGRRFYAFNLLEELDRPGEWYLDRDEGVLYFWPPAAIADNSLYISLLDEPLVTMEDVSHVAFKHFVIEYVRGHAFDISGGEGNTISGCTIRDIGNHGININGGANHTVRSCNFDRIGATCIYLYGGNRQELIPSNHLAENNRMTRWSRIYRTYQAAFDLRGVGTVIRNNLMHNAPHYAINIVGNDHLIEYNEIHHVALETGDVGAINFDRDWSERGNVVRNNYFHHIEPQVRGEGFHETMGIYLDAAASGLMMYGNIFHRVSIAIFINGGRDNTVDNNIFVECNPSIMVSALGIGWANKYITRGGDWAMYKNLEAMPYTEPPWSEKYPRLANIFDGNEIFPEGNIITHNVSWNGRFSILLDGLTFEDIPVKENVIGDEELVVMSTVDRMETTQAGVDNTNIVNELKSYGNIVTAENPGFHNTEFESVEDFQLAKESPAWDIGFQQIPVDSIGLYVDEYRTSVNK